MKFLKAYFSTVNIQIISNAEQANYFHEISQTVQTERYLADEMIITPSPPSHTLTLFPDYWRPAAPGQL